MVNENFAARPPYPVCSYGEEPAGIHADTQEPEQPCHLSERDLLLYCRCLWLSVHLLSPAKTRHTVGYPKLQTVTHMRSSHPAKPLKHFFSKLPSNMCFLFSPHFNHSSIPYLLLHPRLSIYPLSLSFSPSLLIPPTTSILLMPPILQTPAPIGSPPHHLSGDDFSSASALLFSLACPHVFIEIPDGVGSLCQQVRLK